MSETNQDKSKATSSSGRAVPIVSGVVAMGALAAAIYLATLGLRMTTLPSDHLFIRDHAPAVLGLPIMVALAAAVVCGARALEPHSEIDFLGLRARGAGAAVVSWILVFSALVVALRALW